MGLSFVYVCDEAHFARLIIGLESLNRVGGTEVFIVNYGLDADSCRDLERVYRATVIETAFPAPVPTAHRTGAFREKTMAAARVANLRRRDDSPIVLMDSDIIVLDQSFLEIGKGIADRDICMVRSVWDTDFTWSYTSDALPLLRAVSETADFEMNWEIPNSGVVCASPATWRVIGPIWHKLYDRFLALPNWPSVMQANASPGDQEFLRLALRPAGMTWRRLHGTYNMQVSPERMAWGAEISLPLRGGHFNEAAENVRALHFGVDESGHLHLSNDMLANSMARRALIEFVGGLRRSSSVSGILEKKNV